MTPCVFLTADMFLKEAVNSRIEVKDFCGCIFTGHIFENNSAESKVSLNLHQ